jgi:hypothetical protein
MLYYPGGCAENLRKAGLSDGSAPDCGLKAALRLEYSAANLHNHKCADVK